MNGVRKLVERVPVWRDRPLASVTASVALIGFALALRAAFDPVLATGFPFVTFFPAVIVSGFVFGVRGGAVAAILGGFLAWLLYIAPGAGYAFSPSVVAALLLYTFVVVTDLAIIGWMQQANRALDAERTRSNALATSRETMFRELQHRVSNNLLMVGGLLTLQRKAVADPDAQAALEQAARRIAVIGQISRALYDPSAAALGVDRMLTVLCDRLIEASGRDNVTIAVTSNGDPDIGSDAAIPVALIVAEAVANAIEHGFADGRAGRIDIAVSKMDCEVSVIVADSGIGPPAGFDARTAQSLGLRIAHMLAAQLGGTFALERDRMTEARLRFPVQ